MTPTTFFKLAPAPSGSKSTDEANIQPLLTAAQATGGTVVLRAGTYTMDLTLGASTKQPRIVGQGRAHTLWNGTLSIVGTSGAFSGGCIEDVGFLGSHPAATAVSLIGVCDFKWDRLDIQGVYATGILFHNRDAGHFTEQCSGEANFGPNVATAIEYRRTSGDASFGGSGLTEGSTINQSATETQPKIKVGAGARPYKSPLLAHIWTRCATPIISHAGDNLSNFYGHLNVEDFNNNTVLCSGDLVYVGTVSSYHNISYGDLILAERAWSGPGAVQATYGVQHAELSLASGSYVIPGSVQAVGTSNTLGSGNLRVYPVYLPRMAVTRVGLEITAAGSAGCTMRPVIFADNQGKPGTLAIDAGGLAADAIASPEATLGSTLKLPAGIYWIGAALQGAPAVQPTVRTVGPIVMPPGVLLSHGTSVPSAGATAVGMFQAGITGAMPSTWGSAVGLSGSAPRLFFKLT